MAAALIVRTWMFFRIAEFRTDLDRRGALWFLWSSPVKLYDPGSYTARGRALLPWLVACEVAVLGAAAVAMWLLARRGLL